MKVNSTEFLECFYAAYVEAALWSSTGPEKPPFNCENLDDLFSTDDLSPECAANMRKDCDDFIKSNRKDLAKYCRLMGNDQWNGAQRAGHDFWLTRCGHGAGFWDRGLGSLGDRLSSASKVYGNIELYPGDDGLIYGS